MSKKSSSSSRTSKPQRGFGTQAYEKSAKKLLEDLSTLLEALGISANFQITKITETKVSNKSDGNRIAYAFGIGEILSHWYRDSHYLDKHGAPKPLRISSRGPSFKKLAKTCLPGESTPEVLRALKRTGAIEIDQNGLIRPLRRTLTVFADPDLAIHHTFMALKGIVNTLKHNVMSRPTNIEQRFHRIAWSGELRPQDVPRLKVWINKHGQNFLESVDDWMKIAPARGARSSKRRYARASVGVYLDTDAD
jgi:hypothetical protein